MLRIATLLGLLAYAAAECPNACSGHGTCSLHDQCTCCRNWQGNDCSQRTCPFGYAHVDSPKGDLDGSTGTLSGPTDTIIMGSTVYPFGTTEQYPDSGVQEGHFYMECANKGLCNRDDGTCECFPGYEGSACQRASCPNACSGHGTCETIKELAEDREDGDLGKGAYAMNGWASDHAGIGDLSGVGGITYELWDKTLTMGCKCDPGFMGPDCSLKLCRYGVDPLFIPSNYIYSADGVIEYDWDAPHFEKAFVEIVGYSGMHGQFDLTIYDVYGEKYVIDRLNYASFESGNFTSCADIMGHFPNDNIRDTVTGTVYHEVQQRGGLVSTAYVGGMTKPFCTAMWVNQTSSRNTDAPNDIDRRDSGLSINAFVHGVKMDPAVTTGIRYEFDYNRGNPGYIKDLFISNLIPESKYAALNGGANAGGGADPEYGVFGYYGIDKQGEVAEYSDVNKNALTTSNRFMYSDARQQFGDTYSANKAANMFSDGHHDVRIADYGVVLPGYIIQAHNGSTNVLLSRDNHFYLEPSTCTTFGSGSSGTGGPTGSCKDYKTSKLLIFGKEYQINATHQDWFQVEGPHASDYVVGPQKEAYNVNSKIHRPITNVTLSTPLIFPHEMVDYNNITYGFIFRGANMQLTAFPEKVTVRAKLTQVFQYVAECSGRGNCDRTSGLCSCFSGYSHDNCDTQTPVC